MTVRSRLNTIWTAYFQLSYEHPNSFEFGKEAEALAKDFDGKLVPIFIPGLINPIIRLMRKLYTINDDSIDDSDNILPTHRDRRQLDHTHFINDGRQDPHSFQ